MNIELKIMIWLAALFVGAAVSGVVFCASMESAAYNRLTGAKTTTWDAIWLELRVQEGAAK